MVVVRFNRFPEGDGGSAAPVLPPSLSELDNGVGGIQSGDGTPKIPDISQPQPTGEQPASPGTEEKGDGQGEKGTQDEEGKDGQEEKEETGDGTGEEPQEEEQFFDVVEKLTGVHVEVKYPEGTDPVSPEGVALRDQALMEQAMTNFERHLATTNPRAYAFFLHTEAGGSEEDFFSATPSFTLPPVETLKDSVEAQTALYKYDLRSRGLEDDAIEALVQKAIKDNKLQERATTAYQTIDAAQKKQLQDLATEKKRQEDMITSAVTGIRDRIAKATNEEISLVVPEAQKPEFQQFVLDSLQFDHTTGKFWIVQELNQDNIKTQLESLFYQHIKGDLNSIVQKKASTKAAQRLRLQADKAKTGTGGGSPSTSKGTKPLTLGEI